MTATAAAPAVSFAVLVNADSCVLQGKRSRREAACDMNCRAGGTRRPRRHQDGMS
jgi:hypothetical protein